MKLLEQIEHDIWLEFLHCIANGKELILHAERACFVAELPKTATGKIQKGRLCGIERRRSLGLLE